MNGIEIFLPTGPSPDSAAPAGELAARLDSLDGARVGIVNNRWACMETLSRFYEAQLGDSYGVAEVEIHDMAATQWLDEAVVAKYAGRWDAAIVGMGH